MNIVLKLNATVPEGTDLVELGEQFFDFLCSTEAIDDSPLLASIASFDGVEAEEAE
jgi:hypothetical protein